MSVFRKWNSYLYHVAEPFIDVSGILQDITHLSFTVATLPMLWRPKCFSYVLVSMPCPCFLRLSVNMNLHVSNKTESNAKNNVFKKKKRKWIFINTTHL